MQHHPIFGDFDRIPSTSDDIFDINFMGAKVRHAYEGRLPDRGIFGSGRCALENSMNPSLPSADGEDYLEWVDLLESIAAAQENFVIVEAGAGYGRWLINAAQAIRRCKHSNIKNFKLVGIEPDPERFSFMKQHFLDNQIRPEDHLLIQAGVSDQAGYAFQEKTRDSLWSYGDRLIHSERLDRLAAQEPGAELVMSDGSVAARGVTCITLSSVLRQFEVVDLLDCDLQGEELRVAAECIEALTHKVKRVHFGTHSEEIERGLRELFSQKGWRCLNDYSLGKQVHTPFGTVLLTDGIQSWINPRFELTASLLKSSSPTLDLKQG